MTIKAVTQLLETLAPPALQETYDNSGLIIGDSTQICTGILVSLDCLEAVVNEAIEKNCNLIVSHHPIVFSGLKKITGKNYIERVVIKAIKNNIALYALHTNLDNVTNGVSFKMGQLLQLQNMQVLAPKTGHLKKIYTTGKPQYAQAILAALFNAGGGNIGNYAECSFCINGTGTFKPLTGSSPVIGNINQLAIEDEVKLEVLFPAWQQAQIVTALKAAHSYEEVAYEIVTLDNEDQYSGSGVVGNLPQAVTETEFFNLVKQQFKVPFLKHTPLLNKPIKRVALCGGSGSFLIKNAINANADVYLSADIKYHEFYNADNQLVITDIGHYETEQFTIELIAAFLQENISTFAILKTSINTNSVNYF